MIPREVRPPGTPDDPIRTFLCERWAGVRKPVVPFAVFEAASAVAAYCRHDVARATLSDRHLSFLFARALGRSGEPAAALHMLHREEISADRAEAYLDFLTRCESPWPGVDWLARGIYAQSTYTAFAGGVCWAVDWRKLESNPGMALEFDYMKLLRALVEKVAVLWDATSGRGTLMHGGLAQHLRHVIAAGRSQRTRWAREILRWSHDLMKREAASRGWAAVPDCRLADAAY